MNNIQAQISQLLNPEGKISLIINKKMLTMKPIFPMSLLIEILEGTTQDFQQKIINLINHPDVFILGGIIYTKSASVDIQDRIARIMIAYKENIENMLGQKKALIDIYSQLKPSQIIHLIQNNIVFVLKSNNVVAIKYIPEYDVKDGSSVYRFPALMLGMYISSDLKFYRPEVIYDGIYDHMFVYRDKGTVGQKICLGSVESDDFFKSNVMKRDFATSLTFWMTQAEQILRYGYSENRNFTPVYRIEDPKFQRFKIK